MTVKYIPCLFSSRKYRYAFSGFLGLSSNWTIKLCRDSASGIVIVFMADEKLLYGIAMEWLGIMISGETRLYRVVAIN